MAMVRGPIACGSCGSNFWPIRFRGETAHVTPASSTGEVHNYLNGKMGNSSSYYDNLEITVDDSANEILASSMMQGTITATGAGLLDISETYAISGTTTGSTLTLQSPAPQGFLAEIPGVGALRVGDQPD